MSPARIFRRGGLCGCTYVCMHKHARLGGPGGVLPQKIFIQIKCSETASVAILGQKQSQSNFWMQYCRIGLLGACA